MPKLAKNILQPPLLFDKLSIEEKKCSIFYTRRDNNRKD